MTKDEALKLALEALRLVDDDIEWQERSITRKVVLKAITAIKQARSAPVQEPVAHINQNGVIHEAGYEWGPTNTLTPLYPTPPVAQRQWVDPNEKSQKQFLPHIGEPVLFCHDGATYFGKHTGGSFTTGQGITTRNFNTWECHWMYPPRAKLKENT